MKKILLLISALAGITFGAAAQCTPDTTNFAAGKYLYPTSIPCVQRGVAYTNTQTVKVPDTIAYTVPIVNVSVAGIVDSIRIDSIAGLPAGITSVSNPVLGSWLRHGDYACATFSGTTTAPAAAYPLAISGRACGHFSYSGFNFDTCLNYTFTRSYPDTIYVCNPSGVSEISQNLNLSLYPNPNQGTFTVSISSATHVSGTMIVTDQIGRAIYNQSLDVIGTKQIPLELGNIAPGVYMLVVNTDGVRSVKQFVVK